MEAAASAADSDGVRARRAPGACPSSAWASTRPGTSSRPRASMAQSPGRTGSASSGETRATIPASTTTARCDWTDSRSSRVQSLTSSRPSIRTTTVPGAAAASMRAAAGISFASMGDPTWGLPLRIRWDEQLSLVHGDGALPGRPSPAPGTPLAEALVVDAATARALDARGRAGGGVEFVRAGTARLAALAPGVGRARGSGEWRPGCMTWARCSRARRRCRSPGSRARSVTSSATRSPA